MSYALGLKLWDVGFSEVTENSKITEKPDIAENSGMQVDVIKCLTQLYAQLGLLLNQMNIQEQMPGIKRSCATR